jgi:hypothetical protein
MERHTLRGEDAGVYAVVGSRIVFVVEVAVLGLATDVVGSMLNE